MNLLNKILIEWDNSDIEDNGIINTEEVKLQIIDPFELWQKYSNDIKSKYNAIGITDEGEIAFLLNPEDGEIWYFLNPPQTQNNDYDELGYLYSKEDVATFEKVYKYGFNLDFTINWDSVNYIFEGQDSQNKVINLVKKFIKKYKGKKFGPNDELNFYGDIDESAMAWIGITTNDPKILPLQYILEVFYKIQLLWIDYLKKNLKFINQNLQKIYDNC